MIASAENTRDAAQPAQGETPLLSVRDLHVHFPLRSGILRRVTGQVRAVDGVTFDLHAGKTLGLVGESGSGKSTVGRAILRLIPVTSGGVWLRGEDLLSAGASRLRRLRRGMQIVFQDPVGSLNPRMRVGAIIAEPLVVHRVLTDRGAIRARVGELLTRCGMSPDSAARFPHEFSGGQRQRICIARALALEPTLIICDEPTSALDVSIQAQILNLLKDLQKDLGVSYLFISHDMAVVEHMCDRIAVMRSGRIVEIGGARRVIDSPEHPYTRALLAAVHADRSSAR